MAGATYEVKIPATLVGKDVYDGFWVKQGVVSSFDEIEEYLGPWTRHALADLITQEYSNGDETCSIPMWLYQRLSEGVAPERVFADFSDLQGFTHIEKYGMFVSDPVDKELLPGGSLQLQELTINGEM